MGELGDDKAVPTLREWAAPGKDVDTRRAAIGSLGRLDKSNKAITEEISGYLMGQPFPVRMSSIFALGGRGDATAIPALEALLNSNDLSIEMAPMIKGQIARLKKGPTPPGAGPGQPGGEKGEGDAAVAMRLDKLEHLLQEMSERLKAIEEKLPPKK
jgi:hypothetical protein